MLPDSATKFASMTKTVMIVEDNELNMKLFRDLIEAHGYRTRSDAQRPDGDGSGSARASRT